MRSPTQTSARDRARRRAGSRPRCRSHEPPLVVDEPRDRPARRQELRPARPASPAGSRASETQGRRRRGVKASSPAATQTARRGGMRWYQRLACAIRIAAPPPAPIGLAERRLGARQPLLMPVQMDLVGIDPHPQLTAEEAGLQTHRQEQQRRVADLEAARWSMLRTANWPTSRSGVSANAARPGNGPRRRCGARAMASRSACRARLEHLVGMHQHANRALQRDPGHRGGAVRPGLVHGWRPAVVGQLGAQARPSWTCAPAPPLRASAQVRSFQYFRAPASSSLAAVSSPKLGSVGGSSKAKYQPGALASGFGRARTSRSTSMAASNAKPTNIALRPRLPAKTGARAAGGVLLRAEPAPLPIWPAPR